MDPKFKWTTRAEKLLVVAYWWEQQQELCCICGDQMEPYHRDAGKNPNAASVEHLIPKRENGPDTVENVRLAHRSCNNRLGGKWAEDEHRRLIEAGVIKPKRSKLRPRALWRRAAYVFDPRHVQPPSTGQPFVALDKKLVSLPRGATLLPTYKGHMGNVMLIKKLKMTAVETARWLAEQGVRGS